MDKTITLKIARQGGVVTERKIEVQSVRGAGFCMRDPAALAACLKACGEEGNPLPKTTPMIYCIGRYLLTTADEIEVQGPVTGGEVEVVAIRDRGELLITVGSDQCDRELELYSLYKPKQMCPHPLAPVGWPYEDVRAHWDELEAESSVVVASKRVAYQHMKLREVVSLDALLKLEPLRNAGDGTVLFCGTGGFLPDIGDRIKQLGLPDMVARGVGDEFHFSLHDPILNRTIKHSFRVKVLGDDLAFGERKMWARQ